MHVPVGAIDADVEAAAFDLVARHTARLRGPIGGGRG
jgi:hypothetical protein